MADEGTVSTTSMADEGTVTLYNTTYITTDTKTKKTPFSSKAKLAQLLRGGAIFEVHNLDQAKIAESAGACSIIVSEPIINGGCGVWRMADPGLIKEIKSEVSIPVMARVRIGHFVEAQILESIKVDYVDESEILAIADDCNFINKHNFRVPFVCGCKDLGEGLRRIREGAAVIRTFGDCSRSGNICETVRNVRSLMSQIRTLTNMDEDEVFTFAKEIGAPYDIVAQTKQMGRLPVVQFAAGGIVTPADAAMMMQLGCDGVVVESEIFDSADPFKRVRAIVQAVRHYNDAHVLAESCSILADSMADLNLGEDNVEQIENEETY